MIWKWSCSECARQRYAGTNKGLHKDVYKKRKIKLIELDDIQGHFMDESKSSGAEHILTVVLI